jgi:hypothetical protein
MTASSSSNGAGGSMVYGLDAGTHRTLKEIKLRPHGGHAAEDAVSTVLAHKGVLEFEPLKEHEDRNKLGHYFQKVAKPVAEKPTARKTGDLAAAWEAHMEALRTAKPAAARKMPVKKSLKTHRLQLQ